MKDKIIFWFGVDFTQFCMAYYFQKIHDCEMYSIVDVTNETKDFFQHQKLISFEKTWFLDEQYTLKTKPDMDYLKHFEEKYKINLWQLAINERFFYNFNNFYNFSQNEILTILEQICRFYENLFEKISPDFFVTKLTTFHHLELFRLMCKYHNTKILMLNTPKIKNQNLIAEDSHKVDYIENLDEIKCETKSFEELFNYIESKNTKSLVQDFLNRHAENSNTHQIKSLFRFLTSPNSNVKTHYNYFGRTKFKVLKNTLDLQIRKKLRKSFIDRNLILNPDLSEPYVYFPLGVILERHVLIGAPYFTNQVELIRHVAKSLPVGYRLLVKENPAQSSREWRPISEYKEMINIPNTTIIHPSYPQENLLKNSSLVATITGSSSFEAPFYKKPSIVFGDVIYSYLPSVTKVNSIVDLPKIIKHSLESHVNESDLSKYLFMMEKNLINFELAKFVSDFEERFLYAGGFRDVKINENKLLSFIHEKEKDLMYLSKCHVNKIEQHKNHSNH